jgi:histidine triad (HIT) family protein
MENGCVFCQIVAGLHDQEVVYQDEIVVVFLCEPPATWGHVLIVPRAHRPDIWSIERAEATAAMAAAHRIAAAQRTELGAVGVNLR